MLLAERVEQPAEQIRRQLRGHFFPFKHRQSAIADSRQSQVNLDFSFHVHALLKGSIATSAPGDAWRLGQAENVSRNPDTASSIRLCLLRYTRGAGKRHEIGHLSIERT